MAVIVEGYQNAELARFQQPGNADGLGQDSWIIDKHPADDYNVRYYNRAYEIRRQNNQRQGWVCGHLSLDDLVEMRDMLTKVIEAERE